MLEQLSSQLMIQAEVMLKYLKPIRLLPMDSFSGFSNMPWILLSPRLIQCPMCMHMVSQCGIVESFPVISLLFSGY